ncbi:hypothetical protein ACQ86N_09890 [Puia sp. P3]|uniref:hypothetical protein n=1 Tax=Puia sp. P3 TaxID=3423952 RepID=UPI003D66E624
MYFWFLALSELVYPKSAAISIIFFFSSVIGLQEASAGFPKVIEGLLHYQEVLVALFVSFELVFYRHYCLKAVYFGRVSLELAESFEPEACGTPNKGRSLADS